MSVGQTRPAMTSVTSWPLYLNDWPKSPWTVASRVRDELVREERLVEAPARPEGGPGLGRWFGLCESRSGDPGIIRNSTKLSRTIADDRQDRLQDPAQEVARAHRTADLSRRRLGAAARPRSFLLGAWFDRVAGRTRPRPPR